MDYFYNLFFLVVLFAPENVFGATTQPPGTTEVLKNITSTISTTSTTSSTTTTTTSPPKKDEHFSEFQLQQLQELQTQATQAGLPQEDVDNILKYDENLCYTDACLESALEIMKATNFTANPCNPHEWKEFACQRRLDNGIVDSQMDQLDTEAETHTKELLTDKTGKYDKYFLLKEAQTYYQQCLNKGENNEKDVKEILKYMSQKYGNWPLMSNLEPGEKFNWFEMLADMNSFDREGFTSLLLSVDMVYNYYNTDKVMFKVKQGATKYTDKRQENYIHLLVHIYRLSGVDKPWKGTQLRGEKQFLESVADNVEGVSLYEQSNVMTISELQNATDEYFFVNNITLKDINWMNFFQRVRPHSEVTGDMEVNLQFEDVMAVMETVNKTFTDDGMSPVANSLHSHLITMLVQESTSLTDEMTSYQCTETSDGYREHTCRERVKKIFGIALGKAYLSEFYNGPLTTAGIDKMMQTIKGAYKAIIWDTDDWMSNGTKSFLQDKLEDMDVAYVQPEWIDKPEKLKELYKGLKASVDVNSSYAENYLNVQQWYTGKMLKAHIRATEVLSNTPVDKKAYFDYIVLTSFTGDVNAYYLYETNQIFVTGGMSRSPLFDVNRPGFMNYGGLGSVLGHEIGHSFDTSGRKYDKNGNKGEHWDKESANRYENLWVKRIAADYRENLLNSSEIYFDGLTADQTIDEDIADIFGVYLSFESYIDYLTNLKKEGKSELVLPGLKKFTPEKLFYMKYANVWCNLRDSDYVETFITSEHSGTNIRATMPLRRSRQFAETFACPIPANHD